MDGYYEVKKFRTRDRFAGYKEFEKASVTHLRSVVRGYTPHQARENEFSVEVLEFVNNDEYMSLTVRDDLGDVYCYVNIKH